jgi:CRP-like cAMP-binding protein
VRKHGTSAVAGNALGLIRVVRGDTPVVEVVAEVTSTLVGLAVDDVRDVLEEDPAALVAIADRLAALLLGAPP